MKNHLQSATPYPDVNALLDRLLGDIRSILGNHFIGLYLHGSLAYGDFNPNTSDIDILVITDRLLPVETFRTLKAMHARLFTSGLAWSQKLEGAYIPFPDLCGHDPAHPPVPWLGVDGHFALEGLGSNWVLERWILRERGITITGPELKPLIDPIGPQEVRQAVRSSLQEWWSPPFPSPERFRSGEYQAYAVLTMCRSLYVLEHGAIASKPAAARWAMEKFGEPWCALISAAAAWRPGMEFNRLDETVGLIKFTLKKWGLSARGKTG